MIHEKEKIVREVVGNRKKKGLGKVLNDARIIELKITGKTRVAITGKDNL